jgi:hypothetical protein
MLITSRTCLEYPRLFLKKRPEISGGWPVSWQKQGTSVNRNYGSFSEDYRLPGINCIGFLKEIREKSP